MSNVAEHAASGICIRSFR